VILSCFVIDVSADQLQTSRHILDNGLTVVITEIPTSPVVSLYALVKTGSATEGDFLGSGVSHFLEHMLFKGTHKRKVGDVAKDVQAAGGGMNASTGMDYTMYYIHLPYERFATALDVLSDMLMHSTLNSAEVKKEREVIFNEMRLHNDRPERKIGRALFKTVFLVHPYQHPVIGYRELFAKITRDDLLKYYQRYYAPNNMVLSVAGNIKEKDILPQIKETFKDFQRQNYVSRNLPQEPEQISMRRFEFEYPTDIARLSMAYAGVRLLDQDMYALDVLAMILGQGASSRLYLDLYKEKNLVHSIRTSNFTPIDPGIFEVEATLEMENMDETIQNVLLHIEDIKNNGVSEKELEKAKRKVLTSHITRHLTAAQVASSQVIDEAYTGDAQFSQKYVDAVKKITADDILRVAKKYLYDDNLSIVVLQPEQQQPLGHAQSISSQPGSIQKIVLENGLTVLLREDHTFPWVSAVLAVKGGSNQEPNEKSGLFRLMAEMLTKGTTTKSANEIAEYTESLGMGIRGSAGRDHFRIVMRFLPEDINHAFNLMEDIIKNSTFPAEEMDIIKEDMHTALRKRKDNIFRFSAQALRETIFETHPFRRDPLGTQESVDNISRDDIKDLYDKYLQSTNMIISVFGDIDGENVLSLIKQKFGVMPSEDVGIETFHEDVPQRTREKTLELDKEQAMVMIGFQGPRVTDKDRYKVSVLVSVLGSSFSGRLFKNIRDKIGDAYTLGGSYRGTLDVGLIYFYVLTNEQSTSKVKQLLENELKKIQKKNIMEDELKLIKDYLKGNFRRLMETNRSLGSKATTDEMYGLGFNHYQQYDTVIDAVTVKDVREVAQKYLNLNTASIIITTPPKKSDIKK